MSKPYAGISEDIQMFEATDGKIYTGVSSSNEPTSSPVWSITVMLTDGSVLWAAGNEQQDKIFDDAELYTYGAI